MSSRGCGEYRSSHPTLLHHDVLDPNAMQTTGDAGYSLISEINNFCHANMPALKIDHYHVHYLPMQISLDMSVNYTCVLCSGAIDKLF